MYLEDYENELNTDVLEYADHAAGDMLDLSDDDGVEFKFNSKQVIEEEPVIVTDTTIETLNVSMPNIIKPKQSKMDMARAIYARESAKGPVIRKNIIALFVAEVGLTDAGASTYYQKFHQKG